MTAHATNRGRFGLVSAMAASAMALALIATPGRAQIGAIGVVPGGTASGVGALAGTPVFTNSALVLPKGRWAFSGLVGVVRVSADQFDPNLGADFNRRVTAATFLAMGAYALGDRIYVGAMIPPVTNREIRDEFQGDTFKETETGTGDPVLFAKYQFARSGDGRTALAAVGSASLPIGKTGFGSTGANVGLGLVASRHMGRVTLHGEGSVGLHTDEADGSTAFNVNAAGVYALSPRVWLNGEVLTQISDGEYLTSGAPSVRFGIGQRVFLDVGMAFTVLQSVDGAPKPVTALVGLVFAP